MRARLREVIVTALVAGANLVHVPATAQDGLSHNMLQAEAAVGRGDYELAAQYLEAECTADGAIGCYRLAVFEHQGIAGPYNPQRSGELYYRACELGYAEGCASLAEQLLAGEGGAPEIGEGDPKVLAERLSVLACERDSGLGCYNLALIRLGHYGSQSQPREAAALLEKACRLTYASACQWLGDRAARVGIGPAQWSQIAQWYDAACVAGSANGCILAGMLAAEGQAGRQDGEAARRYFEQGCDLNWARACRMLGNFLELGDLIPVDSDAAARAHRRADELLAPASLQAVGTPWAAESEMAGIVLNATCNYLPPNGTNTIARITDAVVRFNIAVTCGDLAYAQTLVAVDGTVWEVDEGGYSDPQIQTAPWAEQLALFTRAASDGSRETVQLGTATVLFDGGAALVRLPIRSASNGDPAIAACIVQHMMLAEAEQGWLIRHMMLIPSIGACTGPVFE